MIVTDQPSSVHFHRDDTIHCGGLLALLVEAKFPGKVHNVDPGFLTVRSDPHRPNIMYPLIRDKLSDLFRQHSHAKFHALPTGGTPAVKDGLRHAAMNVFRKRSRCSVIQVDRPSAGTVAGRSRVVDWEPYLEDVVRGGAQALVKKGNFAGALEVLRTVTRCPWPKAAIYLLKHADHRVNLRAADASSSATNARREIVRTSRTIPTGLDDALNGVVAGDSPASELASVNEIRFLVELALKQARYMDALVRIEQFRESVQSVFSLGVLGWLSLLGQPLPVGTCPPLDDRLRKQKPPAVTSRDGRRWLMRSDRDKGTLFDFALSIHSSPGAIKTEFKKTIWRDLGVVRNTSIHTPAGVSMRSITKVISLGDLKRLLQTTASALYGSFKVSPVPTYPYDALKNAIVDMLAP